MAKKTDRDDEREPKSEIIPGRDLAGASYGATEREQTQDVRRRDPRAESDVDEGGVSATLENESERRPD
ncbi:MAG TPA: hypothetical protein VGP25_11580 [Gemmatimonadaceae bacterium]|jgi:hypothetical protein|nr:hypothetical protein [Gemmatimonadaceae bacterium]